MTARRPRATPIETLVGHVFADRALLEAALTHVSFAGAGQASYERLEFLGDRVLGLVVVHLLFRQYPLESEGALSRRLQDLVRRETLARVARQVGIGPYLHVRDVKIDDRTETAENILADATEAMIGALYLDGGLAAAEGFILPNWQPLALEQVEPPKDPKTALQEWAQARKRPLPKYRVVERSGPDHAPLFRVEVTLDGEAPARGEDGAKRTAEVLAAQAMLDRLQASDG